MTPEHDHFLEDELQRQAAVERPPFSPVLHERIMRAVTRSANGAVVAQAPRRLRARHSTVWFLAASSLLVAALVTAALISQSPDPQPVMADAPVPEVEATPAVAQTESAAPEPSGDGIGAAVDIVGLALNEISSLSKAELFARLEDKSQEIPGPAMPPDPQVKEPQPNVDEMAMLQWTNLEEDARTLASLLTGSLPLADK